MPDIGAPELIIVAIIVLLLFGPGKAADLGGSLGKSIREFRKATREDGDTTAPSSSAPAAPPALTSAAGTNGANGTSGQPVAGMRFCVECGAQAHDGQRFCMSCGKPLATPAS
jgi:sec-independent protein translocase protein TatA